MSNPVWDQINQHAPSGQKWPAKHYGPSVNDSLVPVSELSCPRTLHVQATYVRMHTPHIGLIRKCR